MLGQLLQQASVLTDGSAFSPDIETLRSIAFESGSGRLWTYRLLAALGIGLLLLLARRMNAASDSEETGGDREVDDEEDADADTGGPSLVGDSVAAQAALVIGLVFWDSSH